MKFSILIFCMFYGILSAFSQIDCYPRVGDYFKPIKAGVNLRYKPSLSSEIAFKAPADNGFNNRGVNLTCVEDGLTNGFVKVEVEFSGLTMADYGINENMLLLFENTARTADSTIIFSSFYKQIMGTSIAKELYPLVTQDAWFLKHSEAMGYDVSSFEGFWETWIAGSDNIDRINIVLDNHNRHLYVHNSLIEYGKIIRYAVFLNPDDPEIEDYYIKKIKELIVLKEKRDCAYSSFNILNILEGLTSFLLNKERYFDAIIQLNKYEPYLETEGQMNKLAYLKMQACFFDSNYKAAIDIGIPLVEKYRTGEIINTRKQISGDMDMASVYATLVFCYNKLNRFSEAMSLSKECLSNQYLQHSKYVEYHGALLINLGEQEEACKFLNTHYLNGNLDARNLYFSYCNDDGN